MRSIHIFYFYSWADLKVNLQELEGDNINSQLDTKLQQFDKEQKNNMQQLTQHGE